MDKNTIISSRRIVYCTTPSAIGATSSLGKVVITGLWGLIRCGRPHQDQKLSQSL